MDFITENLLTILILLPVIGAVLTLLHQMFWKQEDHLKWVTLVFTVVNFLVSLLLLGEKGRLGERILFREERAVDQGDKYELSRRRRRAEHLAGDPDDVYNADRGHLDMACGRETADGVLHFSAAAGERDDRRFRLARSACFLSFLRSIADTDVLPDRHLGRRKPHLRGGQVLYLHGARQLADAGGDHRALLSHARPDRVTGPFDFVTMLNGAEDGRTDIYAR